MTSTMPLSPTLVSSQPSADQATPMNENGTDSRTSLHNGGSPVVGRKKPELLIGNRTHSNPHEAVLALSPAKLRRLEEKMMGNDEAAATSVGFATTTRFKRSSSMMTVDKSDSRSSTGSNSSTEATSNKRRKRSGNGRKKKTPKRFPIEQRTSRQRLPPNPNSTSSIPATHASTSTSTSASTSTSTSTSASTTTTTTSTARPVATLTSLPGQPLPIDLTKDSASPAKVRPLSLRPSVEASGAAVPGPEEKEETEPQDEKETGIVQRSVLSYFKSSSPLKNKPKTNHKPSHKHAVSVSGPTSVAPGAPAPRRQHQAASSSSNSNNTTTIANMPTSSSARHSNTASASTATAPSKAMLEQIKQLQAELAAAKKETQDAQAVAKSASAKVERQSAMLDEYQQRCQSTEATHLEYETRVREALITSLRENCERSRKEDDNDLVRLKHRIGRVVPRREGHMVNDYWEEGFAFTDLRRRKQELRRKTEQLTKLRRSLKSKRASVAKAAKAAASPTAAAATASAATTTSAPEFEHPATVQYNDMTEQDEVYKLQQYLFRKELQAVEAQELELEAEKQRLIRRIKLFEDESHSRFNDSPILNKRYLLLRLLGKGGFSEVFKAFDLVEFRYVACKIHQLNPLWSDERKRNYTRHATREYNIHKNLDHQRVVSLFDVFAIDINSFCTVLEFCNGTDLDMYLKTHKTLTEREARTIIGQVFSGLRYLNEQKQRIIHYDLKPGNILFHDGEVKLTDFGLSKIVAEDKAADGIELTSQGAGTYWYLPPECFDFRSTPKITSKVDVWSAGVVLYQMLYGRRPFGDGMSQERMLSERTILNANNVEFPAKPNVSAGCKAFLKKCLTAKPAERPDIFEVFTDRWLKTRSRN
jgi:tousled-like kinase